MVLLVIAVGGLCTVAWVVSADADLVWAQATTFRWWLALPAVALTLANVGVRLLRWQYFLRRSGVRLPMRRSAEIFVAGLAMILTPAYAGEGVKTWLVAREASPPVVWTRAGGVVFAERLCDAVALALVGAVAFLVAGEPAPALVLGLAAAAGAVPAWLALRPWGAVPLAITLLLSVAAWVCGCLTLYVVCLGLHLPAGVSQAVGTYSAATLLGGLTFLPAGVGVVGTAMLVRLEAYGATLQQAVLAAVLVRLFTVWLTAGLGAIGCWRLGWLGLDPWRAQVGQEKTKTHFDALAPAYAEQLSTAARERVVARKVALTVRALRDAGIGPGARILDAGCGHGWYVAALAGAGYRVSGIDLSPGQIAVARAGAPAGATPDPPGVAGAQSSSPPAAPPSSPRRVDPAGRVEGYAAASVLAIPCPGGTFDAALAVNVLHHAGDRATQERAVAEMARVVRPGGLVLVHEISTVNPLYRLYMTYLFPLWKRIDLGTEFWLDPRRPPASASLVLTDVLHYTFLPDFTPRALYRYLEPVERWLEGSRWAPYSAHFTATYHRRPPGAPADLAGADLAGAADLPNATDLANARGTRPPARRSRDGNGISPYIAGVSASPLEGQPR